jgi:hypothetical protein
MGFEGRTYGLGSSGSRGLLDGGGLSSNGSSLDDGGSSLLDGRGGGGGGDLLDGSDDSGGGLGSGRHGEYESDREGYRSRLVTTMRMDRERIGWGTVREGKGKAISDGQSSI